MNCIICDNPALPRLKKGEIEYLQCSSCKTLFSGPLNNADMVGGEFEEGRNEKHNDTRVMRILRFTDGVKAGVRVLDFGCGHGLFVDFLKVSGMECDGYDLYSTVYKKTPKRNYYNIVTLVEVIEHLSEPFSELDLIRESMMKHGRVYIETSFVNIADEEKIPLEEFFYIAPQNGHSTIFSHHGLDLLMMTKGFYPLEHFDRNSRAYYKL